MAIDPYRAVFENAAIGIKWVTADGRLVEANRHLCELLGYSRAELLARHYTEITHPDDRLRDQQLFARLIGGEIPSYSIEKRYVHRDGSAVDARVTSSLVRGETIYRISIIEDSRARHAAEQAATEMMARMHSVLAIVPDAIVVIDERGIIEGFSPGAERTFGWSAAEVLGRNVDCLMPSPDRERHDGYLERYRRTGERRIIGIGRLVTGLRKDGRTFPMQLAVDEVSAEGRRLFTGLVRDVTEQNRSERRLEELQAELMRLSRLSEMSQMSAAIVHELNQPLTAISNYVRACRHIIESAGLGASHPAYGIIDKAIGQTVRAAEVVRRLREFAEKGETKHRVESINAAVEEASALALLGARDAGVVVNLKLSPQSPQANIDKIQVQQVVVNLVRNAVEAMASSPQRILTIRTALEDGMARISVKDTGPGLSPEIADKVFAPFVTTKSTGMGIGLSLSQSIVEAHGGRIWTKPNEGGGTIFAFALPAVPGDVLAREQSPR